MANKLEILSKWSRKHFYMGFTLAETLITLVVIGIVAAITIPALITNYNEEHTKSALKKNYAAFKNAFHKLKYLEGEDYSSLVLSNSQISLTRGFKNDLSRHLSIIKFCGHKEGCFASKVYKKNGSSFATNWSTMSGANSENISFILSDGTSVLFTIYENDTIKDNNMGINMSRLNHWNLTAVIDLNGDRKPNTNGKDIFYFVLTNDGLLPAGIDNKSATCDNLSKSNMDCAAKILSK